MTKKPLSFKCISFLIRPVVVMAIVIDAREAAKILNSTTHGGFPIVNRINKSGTGQFLGMISRTELSIIIAR